MKSYLLLIAIIMLTAYSCDRSAEAKKDDLELRIRLVLAERPATSWDDETDAERDARLDVTAHAIRLGSKGDPEMAAALLALGQHESGWAQYVGEGCDPVPKGAPNCDGGKARGYWQAWEIACPAAWLHPRGSDEATLAFAVCAGKLLRGNLKRCRGKHPAGAWAGAFAGYRSTDCTWEPAATRAQTMQVKLEQLRAAKPE